MREKLNGPWTQEPRHSGQMLYQLSYETQRVYSLRFSLRTPFFSRCCMDAQLGYFTSTVIRHHTKSNIVFMTKIERLILPMALERLRPPLTLPSGVTFPPAFSILVISISSSGLWSIERSTAIPAFDKTHRESPALATMMRLPCINATTAVHPLSLPGC